MDKFKAMMDERIWSLYHIEVEHLCARNKDGSKKTYEQMFYHVPVRKAIERERERADPERSSDSRTYGTRGVKLDSNGAPEIRQQGGLSRGSQGQLESIGVKSSNLYPTRIQGFPAQISGWCKKLKIDYVRTPFPMSAPRGAKTEISWSILE